jgi:hypothetical protein
MLLSEICGFVSGRRSLWREDGSAICSVITPSTWRARFPYLYQPGTGLPSYTPGLKSKSKFLYDWQSVSQSVSQSVCLGIEHPCGTCDQILFPVGMLLSEICGLVSVGHPLWRENGSAICSESLNGPSRSEPETILYCLIRDSRNLEGQVPVFISPRNKVAQLYFLLLLLFTWTANGFLLGRNGTTIRHNTHKLTNRIK